MYDRTGPHLSFSVQSQVQGVIGIMKDNIGKVLDRGEKLEDLEDKSGERRAAAVGRTEAGLQHSLTPRFHSPAFFIALNPGLPRTFFSQP